MMSGKWDQIKIATYSLQVESLSKRQLVRYSLAKSHCALLIASYVAYVYVCSFILLHIYISICFYLSSCINYINLSTLYTAMGIGGGIRQCRRKYRPMVVLRRQVFTYAVFSGFTVLLIIPERFNLVYNQLNHSSFSVPVLFIRQVYYNTCSK